MYNSSYSKHGNMAWKAKKMAKSEGKSCGYYMKIVFFFSSLIQSLIIVSLVLFLVYGQPEHTAEEKRVQELEQNYGRLTMENLNLRAKQKNLTQQLNVTLTAKKLVDKDLSILRKLTNTSTVSINFLQSKWKQCEMEKKTQNTNPICPNVFCPHVRASDFAFQQTEEMLKLVRANFSEKMSVMGMELDNAKKEKIRYQLEAIDTRRDKAFLEERITIYEKMCKEDFVQSLQGIPDVTREFLKRVDELLMKHDSFQLTCEKQSRQLEDIRANCSSLSTEVENKLQVYLDRVGSQVTTIVGANAKYITENRQLKEDSTWCKSNRSAMIGENQKVLKQVQLKHDQDVENLLLQVRKLTGNERLQRDLLSLKDTEVKMLTENIKNLNVSLTSCKALQKSPFAQFPGGAASSYQWPSTGTSGLGTLGSSSTGLGSMGSSEAAYGRTGLTGSSGTGFGSTGSSGTAYTRTGAGGGGTRHKLISTCESFNGMQKQTKAVTKDPAKD
ncbi:plasmalemma vesicle associated protein a [Trichomycterus rosablanca]|uniref:plasmalemma vesicle associated protein a n=1 Tax=Trichomycterus rosablanca TaxID=2290929 RepID=UPI002F35318A